MTDNDLVRECLVGRMESYRELMDRYRDHAMAIAVNILANREDAEDACQEAFLKAYQNLDRFDANRSYKNWFYALLSNHCLDMIRKRARFKGFIGRLGREKPTEIIRPPASSPFFKDLEFRYLRPLTPKERTALFLWSQEGYSTAEIASVLRCSPNTAGVHLYRARVKLKTLLKEEKDART